MAENMRGRTFTAVLTWPRPGVVTGACSSDECGEVQGECKYLPMFARSSELCPVSRFALPMPLCADRPGASFSLEKEMAIGKYSDPLWYQGLFASFCCDLGLGSTKHALIS
jgi:hypothetical protein